MRRLFPFSFALALLLISSAYTQQRQLIQEDSRSVKRVALVIGNSAYETAPLKNPVNDAQDMAQTLRELGFEVIYRENLNQTNMKRAIREFGAKIRNGGVGLFYYAGHGVAVKGVNYLVPVDAKVESEEEVEYECVDAGFVLAQMESAGNNMNVVILDACRNNPFVRSFRSDSRGLAQMDAPSGTLIAYATAPGSIASDGSGRNSFYTQELLKNMRTPGIGIEEVFKRVRITVRNLTQNKQTPWESSSLAGNFYFTSSTPQPAMESRPPSAKTEFKTQKGNFSVWIDTTKWRLSPQAPGEAEYFFIHKNGSGYALIIPERISFPSANLKEIILQVIRQAAPDAKIISEEMKIVNEQKILSMKTEGTINGVPVTYYGYYYTGEAGSLQVVTYTPKSLFKEFEQEFTEFLNGTEIHPPNR